MGAGVVAAAAVAEEEDNVSLGICPNTPHRHEPPARTGCAFPDARRANGLCGREPVAVYTNRWVTPMNSLRCDRHDSAVIVEAAAALGFRRVALETKAHRLAAVDAHVARMSA